MCLGQGRPGAAPPTSSSSSGGTPLREGFPWQAHKTPPIESGLKRLEQAGGHGNRHILDRYIAKGTLHDKGMHQCNGTLSL